MNVIKNELVGLAIGAFAVPLILPVYVGYHLFYKEKSTKRVPENHVQGTVVCK